jgi:hypothetical protein
LQVRDIEILKLVYELRFASTEHIGHLVPGSYQQIQRRLRGLYDEHYLDRPPEQNARRNNRTQHYVYALGSRGAEVLRQDERFAGVRGDWTEKNREAAQLTILHQLMIGDFRTVLTLALRESGAGQIVFWQQGQQLLDHVIWRERSREFKRPVYPDAWFVIRTARGDRHFFLEADNSTMRHDRMQKKLEAYFRYWMAGQEEYRHDHRREKNLFARARAFRVLTVAKSPERAENLRQVAKTADPKQAGSSLFWFAATNAYSLARPAAVLGPIWRTPKEDAKTVLL